MSIKYLLLLFLVATTVLCPIHQTAAKVVYATDVAIDKNPPVDKKKKRKNRRKQRQKKEWDTSSQTKLTYFSLPSILGIIVFIGGAGLYIYGIIISSILFWVLGIIFIVIGLFWALMFLGEGNLLAIWLSFGILGILGLVLLISGIVLFLPPLWILGIILLLPILVFFTLWLIYRF